MIEYFFDLIFPEPEVIVINETPRDHAEGRWNNRHHDRVIELAQAQWRLGGSASVAEIFEEAGYE